LLLSCGYCEAAWKRREGDWDERGFLCDEV
jgi:hypothetical protein